MNDFEAWQKIVEVWKQVDRMKVLNQRLYDELGSAIIYILEYSRRNNIDLPNGERLFKMVENIHVTTSSIRDYHNRINNNSSPKTKHPFSTPDDETEPKIFLCE